MFSHTDIWRGIDRLADSFGYSPSGLAKKAGLDPTSFNKSKRMSPEGKQRWPSTESIAKILHVTGATMSDFIALIDGAADSDSKVSAATRHAQIPIIGFAKAGQKGYFDEDGYPAGDGWGMIDFPGSRKSRGEHVFALEVTGQSMKPLFRKGDILILSSDAQIRRFDRVVLQTTEGEVLAKEVLKKSAHAIELGSLNPDYEPLRKNMSDIRWIARVLWVSQ
jgi:phage repressor protein C with HTH and peptisase S24 domain